MIKTGIVTIIAVLCMMVAKGQRPDRPPRLEPKEMAKQMVCEFAQKVKISSAVQDSLNAVFGRFFADLEKNYQPGERPSMDSMKKAEEARDLNVKKFLTDEQFKAYQQLMEEKQSQRRGGPGGDGMQGPPPERKK